MCTFVQEPSETRDIGSPGAVITGKLLGMSAGKHSQVLWKEQNMPQLLSHLSIPTSSIFIITPQAALWAPLSIFACVEMSFWLIFSFGEEAENGGGKWARWGSEPKTSSVDALHGSSLSELSVQKAGRGKWAAEAQRWHDSQKRGWSGSLLGSRGWNTELTCHVEQELRVGHTVSIFECHTGFHMLCEDWHFRG